MMKLKNLTVLVSALITAQAFAIDEVIVTGAYSPVSSEQVSSYVTVINRDELLQLSSHSLVDALRQVPSIWVEEQGGPGGITAIALRGAESNHTLVLLDGVQLNDPTNTRGGAFDVNNINIDSIKRIEIIRGAQSAIYGSDALAGVIHIITVEPTKNAQQNFSAAIGEDGYKTASFTTSGALDNIGYAVKLQSKDAGEPIEGSTAKNKEALVKLNWKEDAHTLDFSYRYFDGERTNFPEQSGGPLFAVSRDLDHSDYTDQNASLSWLWQISDTWKSKIQGAWFNRDENISSPGIENAWPANGAITDFTRNNISWINTLGNEKTFWMNIGLETKQEDGDSKGYLIYGEKIPADFALNRRINSVFININDYLTPDFLIQGSVRRDDAVNIITKTSTQIGVRYQINSEFTWFANHGDGFKLPSFFALGYPGLGNPDLKPETVKTSDTGIEWKLDNTSVNVDYFYNKYNDLIDFNGQTNVNRPPIKTSGVETEIHWHSQQWSLGAHASYADIDAQNPLMGRPQTKAGATVGYILDEHWQFNANYLWVGERYSTSQYTGEPVLSTLDTYHRVDVGAKWKFNSQISVNASIENITDEKIFNEVGFPAIGRYAVMGVSVDF